MKCMLLGRLPCSSQELKDQNTWNSVGEEENATDGAGGVDRHQILQGFVDRVKDLIL